MKKLNRHPVLVLAILFLIVWGAFYFSPENAVFAILFLAAGAFANTLWLNERINRLQEALMEKGHLQGNDFVLDDKLRETMERSSPPTISEALRKHRDQQKD